MVDLLASPKIIGLLILLLINYLAISLITPTTGRNSRGDYTNLYNSATRLVWQETSSHAKKHCLHRTARNDRKENSLHHCPQGSLSQAIKDAGQLPQFKRQWNPGLCLKKRLTCNTYKGHAQAIRWHNKGYYMYVTHTMQLRQTD